MSNPTPITDDELARIERAHKAATRGPWYTVEAPWRATYYNRETGEHEHIPTYVIAGSDDPHAGKPVIDAVHIEEWETEEQKAAFVSQTDADLDFCCVARQEIPRLVAEIRRYRRMLRALNHEIHRSPPSSARTVGVRKINEILSGPLKAPSR